MSSLAGPAQRSGDGKVILGVDPGLTSVGWGVVLLPNTYIASGVFKPKIKKVDKNKANDYRLKQIYDEIVRLVAHYKPDKCVVEDQYFSPHKPKGLKVAQAKGAIIAGFGMIPYANLTPSQIKKMCTGDGNASKEDVARAVSLLMVGAPKEFKSDDESDSLGIAWAG